MAAPAAAPRVCAGPLKEWIVIGLLHKSKRITQDLTLRSSSQDPGNLRCELRHWLLRPYATVPTLPNSDIYDELASDGSPLN